MPEETLAWQAIKPGHKIIAGDGSELGSVHRVLADAAADIFHGVSLRRRMLGPEVEITADRIGRITASAVHTTLGPGEVDSLPSARRG